MATPCLPHELFSSQQKDAAATDSPAPQVPASSSIEFPRLPHELFKKEKKNNVELIRGPCHLFLHSVPSPPSSSEAAKDGDDDDELTSNIKLQFNDWTKVIVPETGSHGYAFPCPLAKEPFIRCVSFKALEFSSLHDCRDIPEFPMEHRHREFLKTEIREFVHRAVQEAVGAKSEVNVYVTVYMERRVGYEETAKLARVMEAAMEGRWRDEREDSCEKRECAVCCNEIESRWSEEGELFCGHVFHWGCIAPWMSKKNTCPLCRYVQN